MPDAKKVRVVFTTVFTVISIASDINFNRQLMPYPCSHFYFDINFGDRLYSKEKRKAWPLHF